jgi:sensor histidine kinase regulating citrate/malate metabolism
VNPDELFIEGFSTKTGERRGQGLYHVKKIIKFT